MPNKKPAKKKIPVVKADVEEYDPGNMPEDTEGWKMPERMTDLPVFEPPKIGRPLKFPDLESLKKQIEMYFAFCEPHMEMVDTPLIMRTGNYKIVKMPQMTKQRPYTISGLAEFLGTSRTTLMDYENLAKAAPNDIPLHLRPKGTKILRDYSYTIKKAKDRVERYVEERLMGGGHPAGPIFNLKNNFKNWEDKTIQENPQDSLNREAIEELRGLVVGRLSGVKKRKA